MNPSLLAVLVIALGSAPTPAPKSVVVVTSRGEVAVPVTVERGHPALPVPDLALVLPITDAIVDDWALVAFGGEPFRFLLGAPVLVHQGRTLPLAGGAYLARDTLFVPLQWLAEYVPHVFSEGYRYDPVAARFEELRVARVPQAAAPQPAPPRAADAGLSDLARRNGFRMPHLIVVDAGHGGPDPGNPGRYFPRGVKEKHVTLGIAKRLREELQRRGVAVVMTRTSDTLIDLRHRARICRDRCDLFVSIHVNSLTQRRGYERVNGIETYFLGEALTAEAQRVAQMENEALRYETGGGNALEGDLSFIFKDLQTNEFLRESAALADLVQNHASSVHPGEDRGVAQNRFVVLATATRPAVLIETGFSTNRADGKFLASADGQRKIAQAIANGIVEYLKQYERRVLVEGGD